MKNSPIIILCTIIVFSCTKNSDYQKGSFLTGSGVFVVNEGNFRGGNGSLSFYSYDSAKINNDLFLKVNGWPLGDVPNSMTLNGDRAYVVVNNSGKIEVINKNTLESVKTIDGLISPRNMAVVSSSKAYVTSMYSNNVAIINLTDNSISGYINLRRTSESIVVSGSKAFISNWVGGKEIMVINTLNDNVVDSIEVGIEPESMVLDKNKILWVLCNGGWTRTNYAELTGINSTSDKIEKRLVFSTKQASPSCLQIDGTGETLYYLDGGVRQMKITSMALPSTALIPESDHYFYKIGINPVNSDIFATDAADYQNRGSVLHYKKDGTLLAVMTADIIPGLLCFKLNDDFKAK